MAPETRLILTSSRETFQLIPCISYVFFHLSNLNETQPIQKPRARANQLCHHWPLKALIQGSVNEIRPEPPSKIRVDWHPQRYNCDKERPSIVTYMIK